MDVKKIAVVLSGCGHKDGSEITEAVSTLIALSEMKAQYQLFAPDQVVAAVNHLTDAQEDSRNALNEAARIGRGKVKNLNTLKSANFDALIFPGGFGAAKVLCNFAQAGHKCEVLGEAERVINEFYKEEKPIAALCIAPALVARVLGHKGVTVTIGNDLATASEIKKTGAHHEDCAVGDYVTDREHHLITTPAYMYSQAQPHEVFYGIRRAIKELVEMA